MKTGKGRWKMFELFWTLKTVPQWYLIIQQRLYDFLKTMLKHTRLQSIPYLEMAALDEYCGIFRLLNKQQDIPSEEDYIV